MPNTHSLYGRKVGFDNVNNRLVVPGLQVTDPDYPDSSFLLPSPKHVVLFDDFLGDTVDTNLYLFTEGTDSATSAAALLAGGIGGVLRLTTGDAGTGYAADAEQMTCGLLQWQASNGGLTFQTRLKLSAITTCQVFLGFTDDVSTLEIPIDSAASANTITTTATDAVGFFFDTDMSTDNWWIAGVANNVDATHQNTGFAPVADTYATFRIEVGTDGSANFFYNGAQVGTTMSGAITAATDLTPVITVSKLSVTASMTLDIDYLYVAMNR